MGNQRPPGKSDNPPRDPEREAQAPDERHYAPSELQPGPAQPWLDPERTRPYAPQRRRIADRLNQMSREPESGPARTEPPPGQAKPAQPAPPAPRQAPVRPAPRAAGGRRMMAVLAGVTALGLAAGAAAAWFSGWRPGFLAGGTAEDNLADAASTTPPKPADKPGDAPPETKPADIAPAELARSCFTGRTEVKPNAPACGFALEPSGVLSFQGARIAERFMAGARPAQRLLLYPFAPSGRFVFLRACERASGGRCALHRLVDTKEKKVFEVKGEAEDLRWTAFSPKEQVGLLGYRDGTADSIAAVATADGKLVLAAAIRSKRNQYAMVKESTLRWPDEESFSIEVKLCTVERGGRNAKCEQDDKIRYRRRVVRLAR